MHESTSAADFLPKERNLTSLQVAAETCRGCDLYVNATQTVFGDGARCASVMFIGEMPGDREDIEGKPFVGPAGRLLAEILEEVGLARSDVYLTNAVKHFHWEQVGPRRLHKKPKWRQVRACQPWLTAEIEVIRPRAIVCLGATAAQTLLGSRFRLTKARGQRQRNEWADVLIATYHPSALLRAPDNETRDRMRAELVGDLKSIVRHVKP